MAKVSDRAVLVYQIERRSRSDCVHEQVAKRIANVRFILGPAKHEKVAIYVVNQRISNVCRIART